eukprot:488722_1
MKLKGANNIKIHGCMMSVAIDKQHIDNAIQKCVQLTNTGLDLPKVSGLAFDCPWLNWSKLPILSDEVIALFADEDDDEKKTEETENAYSIGYKILYQDQSDDAEWNVISDLGETTTYNIASWGVEQCNAKVVYEINDMLRSPPSDPIHCRMVTLFEYESDFDHNGIIFCLGLDLDEDDWQNPSEKGTINIESTPLYWNSETIHHFVGRKAARCITKSIENAWFGVDFKGLQINPTHYTLRHYVSNNCCLRSWDFEGSRDGGKEWITIKKHTNDRSLQGKGSSHTWEVDQCNEFYSLFRIRMTGKNSSGDWCLCCS